MPDERQFETGRRRGRDTPTLACRTAWMLAAMLALVAGCTPRVNPVAKQEFQAAQAAFDSARTRDDFLRVAARYEQLVQSGVVSGAIFYNQGNAYMRAGHRGQAIACYRQAKRYRPRDPLLDANLRSALGTAGAPTGETESRSILEYLLFWQDWISYPGKFQLSSWCAAVTLAVGFVSLFHARSLWKRAAVAGLLVTLAISCSAVYDWYRFERTSYGVLVSAGVVARKGDAESYEPAFTQSLPEGTEFLVLERRRDWVRIRLGASQEGWVKATDAVIY